MHRRRWAAPIGLGALGALLAVLGGPPVVNNSLSVWFVEDDPARVAYESFQSLFGNDEVVVLAIGSSEGPIERALLDRIATTAERMRTVEGIASVAGPEDAAAGPLAELLLDEEGSMALLLARFDVMDDADARRHDILVALREASGALEVPGVDLHWAGIGLVYDELNEISFRETPVLTGASFAVVGLVLLVVVRSVMPVVIALASVVVAILILLGAFSLLGFELNMVTAVLPTLLLVVGTANAVHIYTRLRGVPPGGLDGALRDVFRPCLFTAVTTAAGFASLATARMAVIRDLGLFAAVGVLIVFVTSFVFVRAAASTGRLYLRTRSGVRPRRPLEALSNLVVRRPLRILACAGAVTVLAFWAANSVVVDTYSIEFFRDGHPVRVDSDAIEARYGWYLPLEFAVHSGRPDGALEPELLRGVADWQARVEEAGLAQWSLSVADFARATGAPQGRSLASEDAAPALDPIAAGLLNEARSSLRVTFGVPMASARAWEDRIEAIRARAGEALPAAAEMTAGGYLPLYVRMMEYVVDTQIRSFAAALLLVFTVMALFLRSPRSVLISLLPNLLPIVLLFGVMGALGIRLDIATVTVAAIALGIVVDDTVHFLHRFREELARTGDPVAGVRSAYLHVGPALTSTTVILASSFAALGFASVLSIAHFGLLSSATLAFALLSDLLVLPALLVVFVPRRPGQEVPHLPGGVT